MFSPGPWQFAILLLIVLLLFGKRLPQMMRSLGEGATEFKKGLHGVEEDKEKSKQSDDTESSDA